MDSTNQQESGADIGQGGKERGDEVENNNLSVSWSRSKQAEEEDEEEELKGCRIEDQIGKGSV